MKQVIQSIVLATCLGLGTQAVASENALKLGVLDWQQLSLKAPQAEAANKRLEKEFEEPKAKLLNKQKEFQTKREKIQRDKDVMSVAERAKQEKELSKMEQDLRRLDEEYRSDTTGRQREEMDQFIKIVREIVEKYSKEEKYDLVIPQEFAIYMSDKIDITSKILERLEKASKK